MTSPRPKMDVLAVLLDVGLMLENSAVFQSQVAGQMIALSSFGYRVGILAVVRDSELFDHTIGARLLSAGIVVETVTDRSFLRNLLGTAAALRRLKRRSSISYAYVRGLWGPLALALANPLARQPYVYDVRGALTDEASAVGASRFKRFVYATLEAWGIRKAARVSAVSSLLAETVSITHSINNVAVVPCCIEFAMASVSDAAMHIQRAEFCYQPNEIVLVYAGGLSHYQQIPEMLALWRRLYDDPLVQFLLLTNDDPHSLPAVVGNLNDFGDRLRHLALPHTAVAAALAAADIGFMLRDARDLNRVASPVKFPEYLAAGLAIVASPGTGDASPCILANDVGVLVDTRYMDDAVAEVRSLLAAVRGNRSGFRERARNLAATSYDWSSMRSRFEGLYGPPDHRYAGIERQ